MNDEKLETIHKSLVNGQRKQMVKQIDEYGLYDFWSDYKIHLKYLYVTTETQLAYFSDAVISYHRIKSRRKENSMEKITVYDYKGVWNRSFTTATEHQDVKKMDVKASCVGGKEGILAFFNHENRFCIAQGDDGHWWLMYTCDESWEDKIKESLKPK